MFISDKSLVNNFSINGIVIWSKWLKIITKTLYSEAIQMDSSKDDLKITEMERKIIWSKFSSGHVQNILNSPLNRKKKLTKSVKPKILETFTCCHAGIWVLRRALVKWTALHCNHKHLIFFPSTSLEYKVIHEELQKGLINACLVSVVKTFENFLLPPSFMVIHLKKSLSLAETHVSYIYTLRETLQRPKYYVTKLMICISHRICCNRYLWPSWQQIKQCPISNPWEGPSSEFFNHWPLQSLFYSSPSDNNSLSVCGFISAAAYII